MINLINLNERKIMNRLVFILATVSILLANADFHQDRLLVYLDNSQPIPDIKPAANKIITDNPGINELLEKTGAVSIRRWLPSARPGDHTGEIYLNRYYVIEFGAARSNLESIRDICFANEMIKSAELLPVLKPSYEPNDTYFSSQWALPNVKADQAWDIWDINGGAIPGKAENREIKVGIVDTGVDWDHPDLVGNIWQNLGEDANGDGTTLISFAGQYAMDPYDRNGVDDDGNGKIDDLIGWDTAENDNDPQTNTVGDAPWHGTGVAGCVASMTNNSLGVASVGWGLTLIPVKIADDTDGSLTGAYDGILYAAQAGADVINCSWGGFGSGGGGQSVIDVAFDTYGAIVVASSGNGNEETGYMNLDAHYPSGYNDVISVTANGQGDRFNCWATGGTTVDLAAPGESVLTTYDGGSYASVGGTSFSSPIVAGAVGLLWSRFPENSKEWVIDRIINTTDVYDDMDRTCSVYNYDDTAPHSESMTGMLGSGRLNVFKAIAGDIYPNLVVQEANISGDSDGDGVFNPGESINLKPVVYNEEGWATASGVMAVLTSSDGRITITDPQINYTSDIAAGETTVELFDPFQLSADASADLGDVELTVTFYVSIGSEYHAMEDDIIITLSLNQPDFPFNIGAAVESSPLAFDDDGDGLLEICFGSSNFNFYSITPEGVPSTGFPLMAGNQISGSPAIADLEGDGDLELVYGSRDKNLYIVNTDGTIDLVYPSIGEIFGSAALADLDGDDDFEIIFCTADILPTGQGGHIYAIHHDSSAVEGYPINIGEIMMSGPAVGDIDNDGIIEVVAGTWSNNVYAVSGPDSIEAGFPYATGGRINVAPVLADLAGDSKLEIVAGSDDKSVHIIDSDGNQVNHISTGNYIRGGFCLHDVNSDDIPEIFWGGWDSNLHVWDQQAGAELAGWPVAQGNIVESAPVVADLDNDGSVEVVCANNNGNVVAYHLDGAAVDNFPVRIEGSIGSSPAVQDVDNDGDFDIMIGTTLGLEIIDYKQPAGDVISWKVYRGSYLRTGCYTDAQIPLSSEESVNTGPSEFRVSANYPNPFNPSTNFEIIVADRNFVSANIYNVLGQKITRLINDNLDPGTYQVRWDGRDQFGRQVSSGIYLLQVSSGEKMITRKLALVK